MVMVSGSKGRKFESWHRIVDGHFFAYVCCKNCNVCLKRQKNEKGAGVGPFFLKKRNFRYPTAKYSKILLVPCHFIFYIFKKLKLIVCSFDAVNTQ